MILVVNDDLSSYQKIIPSSFELLKIWERKHLQEWIRQAPDLLGEELLVVSTEFDRFENYGDRLDILAIDRSGNLVVVELKRDSYAGYADLQSIRYAAMVSSMTIETLLPYYLAYQKDVLQIPSTREESIAKIEEFVENDSFEEFSNKPRIILCSADFSQQITTTVLWLNQSGLDISCVKIIPHKVGGQVIIVPNKIIPLQEAKQYLIDIQKKGVETEERKRSLATRTMKVLIANGLVKEGDKIYLRNQLPRYMKIEEGNPSFEATITGKAGMSNAILWSKDSQEYAISSLTWSIFKEHHPQQKDPGGVNGNVHWVTAEGKSLWDLKEEFLNEKEISV